MTGAADLRLGCGHVPHGCSPQIPAGRREGQAFNKMFLQKPWPTCAALLISALLTPTRASSSCLELPLQHQRSQVAPSQQGVLIDVSLPRAGSSNHIPTQPCTARSR